MNRIRACVSLGFALLGSAALTGCTQFKQAVLDIPGVSLLSGAGSGVDIQASEPFLLGVSDRPMPHGFFSFPVVRAWSNTIMVAWSTEGDLHGSSWISLDSEGHKLLKTAVPSPAVSTNGGQTWEMRAPAELDIQRTNVGRAVYFAWNAGLRVPQPLFGYTVLHDGTTLGFNNNALIIVNGRDRTKFQAAGMGMECKDGAWGIPFDSLFEIQDLDLNATEAVLFLAPHGVELEDGRILLAAASRAIFPYKLEGQPGALSSFLFASDDRGRTFHPYSVIASPRHATGSTEGATEPSVIQLPNGELLCAMRTGGGGSGDRIRLSQPLLMARSQDHGLTWKRYSSGRSGVWPVLQRMSNGLIVCSYGRPGNRVMFSSDEGRTWFKTIVLTGDNIPTSGYTDVCEVSPGRLLATYDEREYAPPGKKLWDASQGLNVVYGRFIDVQVKVEDAGKP